MARMRSDRPPGDAADAPSAARTRERLAWERAVEEGRVTAILIGRRGRLS
jgi:hypothetical protein